MKGAHPSLKWAAGLVVLAAVGCGGGGSSPGPPPPPPPPAQLTVTTSSLAAGLTGQSYHVELQASGGTAPYTWNLLSGSFPAGVGMSSTGTIFGTPEAKGTFNVTVQVQDAASRSATRALTLTVTSGLTLNTSALPQGRWYKPYDFFLQAFAGVPPYQWSLASGSGPLPAGFNLFSNGEVNGTTTVPGTYNLLIQVQDTLGDVVSRSFTLEIADSLVVTSGVLPFTIAGQPYSTTLEAKGGAPPYSWDLAADSFPLPNGLSLSTAGVISGTTTLMGSTSLHVNVRDATGATDSGFLLLRMALPLGISTASLPDGNVGVAYLQQLFGSGGYFQGGFNWRLASGSGPLPPGVELRFDGLVSGSPTAAGTFPITVELRDITGQDVTKDLSILIKNDVVVTTTALAYGIVNQPYADSLKAVGGTPPYTWSVGGLPTGLLLNADSGALSGAPTQADTFSLSVQANDSSNPPKSGTATLPMLVRPPLRIVTSTLPDGAATRFYSAVVAVEGGHFPPYKARVASGQLPPGITLFPDSDFAGNFSMGGSPTATGVTDFTIEVSDSGTPPLTAAASFHIRVNPNLSVSDATLPDSVEGQSFSVTFTAAGGAPPYTWTAPTTPTGVTMNPSTGELSGAPTQPYVGNIVIRVQDSASPPQVTDRAFF